MFFYAKPASHPAHTGRVPLNRRHLWLAAMLAATAGALTAQAADPDALWHIVHDRCVPAGNPCVLVRPDDAVLKDLVGRTQFLLIPTARITGIESPAVLAPGAPNYVADAWDARRFVEQRAGRTLPPDAIALAVNPPGARSQEQLHIHVDCLRPDVRAALQILPLTGEWATLPAPLEGQRYWAMRTGSLDPTPFRLLADRLPGARDAMGSYTLVVVGRPDGFTLLAGRIGADGRGHGEDLQDHSCALAQNPGP